MVILVPMLVFLGSPLPTVAVMEKSLGVLAASAGKRARNLLAIVLGRVMTSVV